MSEEICEIQVEAYEKGVHDIYIQDVFDSPIDVINAMKKWGDENPNISRFEVTELCGGSYFDGTTVPPFKKYDNIFKKIKNKFDLLMRR